jgi:hypothetical protein
MHALGTYLLRFCVTDCDGWGEHRFSSTATVDAEDVSTFAWASPTSPSSPFTVMSVNYFFCPLSLSKIRIIPPLFFLFPSPVVLGSCTLPGTPRGGCLSALADSPRSSSISLTEATPPLLLRAFCIIAGCPIVESGTCGKHFFKAWGRAVRRLKREKAEMDTGR